MNSTPESVLDAESVRHVLADSASLIASLAGQADGIAAAAAGCVAALKAGGKILTAGNGGSAAEALHMAEEFTGRFRGNRPSLPAIALTADCTVLTCIANDFGFDFVFSRQVESLGKPGDVLVLFSTSGNAANLEKALEAARAKGMKVLCLLGKTGGRLKGRGDWDILVNGVHTERIQEAHQVILHLVLEAAERAFPSQRG
jgi:D-sedoheptulose 7-phosphate isomerase